MSPRAVDKRARPGNLGSSTIPEPPADLTHLDELNPTETVSTETVSTERGPADEEALEKAATD
jgi:hypothetical protein